MAVNASLRPPRSAPLHMAPSPGEAQGRRCLEPLQSAASSLPICLGSPLEVRRALPGALARAIARHFVLFIVHLLPSFTMAPRQLSRSGHPQEVRNDPISPSPRGMPGAGMHEVAEDDEDEGLLQAEPGSASRPAKDEADAAAGPAQRQWRGRSISPTMKVLPALRCAAL